MTRSLLAWLVALVATTTTGTNAGATSQPQTLWGETVEVVAADGQLIGIGDDLYEGPLTILPRGDGVTAIESLPPEQYLLGIREVPFAWPDEALKTQAVAARTYLAYTLAGGRTATGRAHGYDICATTTCQVYAGVAGLTSRDGQRWAQAIAATAGEILIYEGRPAQTLYSSTAGSRTRESEDIFPGLDVPYLAAVDSPGEDSPFVRWSFAVTRAEMIAMLRHAGLINGPLKSVAVVQTQDGGGPWQVEVRSGGSEERVGTYRFRTLINSAARDLFPDRLPANRPDGPRYPQTVLSGTFTIRTDTEMTIRPGIGPVWSPSRFVFLGEGWGHQVGMSQYGALAMAESGSSYADILAHYYGGLLPQPAGGWLPESILVGLVVGSEQITVTLAEGATVLVDGVPAAPVGMSVWRFRRDGDRVITRVPVGIGTRPSIVNPRVTYRLGRFVLRLGVSAPSYLKVNLTTTAGQIGEVDLGLTAAGEFVLPLADLVDAGQRPNLSIRVNIETTSPHGGDQVSLPIVPDV
ncbi:MAG: SpoIID/LytB domain-containing protein [Acidimicrobiia bacterium]